MEKKEIIQTGMIIAVVVFAVTLFTTGIISQILKGLALIIAVVSVIYAIAKKQIDSMFVKSKKEPDENVESNSRYTGTSIEQIKQKFEIDMAKKQAEMTALKADLMLAKARGEAKEAKRDANRKTDILSNLGVDLFKQETSKEETPKRKKDIIDNLEDEFYRDYKPKDNDIRKLF